ncbi:hypothetical protein ABIF97_004229 [Bradyrhizobium japonicum]
MSLPRKLQQQRRRTSVPFTRKRPERKPWPDDIEHERVVIDAPTSCACCGGSRLAKIGEDVIKTLEEIPRRFKVIETVREKFTCRVQEDQPAVRTVPCYAASLAHNCWRRSCSTVGSRTGVLLDQTFDRARFQLRHVARCMRISRTTRSHLLRTKTI